jgi:hypothetical protein
MYANEKDQVSFSDGFPFLIASKNSLNHLNQSLQTPIEMVRFRPNLVIDGCGAYDEDTWREISIGNIDFRLPKPCSRCAIPGINPQTAQHEKEPLTALSQLRKWQNKTYFGQNALHNQSGELNVGDKITVNLIGNGTWALLQNRDQLELLRDDPAVEATAIDELLRYDSPVQISRRITLEPIQVGGRDVAAGTFVLTSLGSANRDPAVFGPTADQLDLRRADAARHLAFGSGTHHCLGASLARMEGTIAITRLIRRFPELQAMSAPAWNGRLVLRGMDSLQLSLR